MNEYLELGTINRLKVVRESDYGLILASSKEKEVLLPKRYVTETMEVGDTIDVFIYTDSEDRIVATTEQPKAMLGEVTEMEVVDITHHGAYLDWGLPKDLFVPKMLQRQPMRKGERHLIYVDYDERTHRLVGTQKFEKRLKRHPKELKRNQEVDLFIYAKTDLGYKVIVNKKYDGLIFHSEVFEPITIGESKKGYVKIVRSDGKIDILLRPIGKKSDTVAADKVMAYLNDHKGMMPLNYKSDPERIKELLGLSRKNFKRALTKLIDAGKIEVKEHGTFLKARSKK
ncbi:MAG: DNA-binding protein [Hydrogenimonas sp.]|nr:MAG: DNA-binding protein [Hydrogenimonas sp.]